MSSRGKWFLWGGIAFLLIVIVGGVYLMLQNLASADVAQNGGCKLDATTNGCVYSKFKIYPDKASYLQSEQIKVTLENTSSKSIYLPNSAPWQVLDSTGAVVFEPARSETKTAVEAGKFLSWSWDQKTSKSSVADPGRYTFRFFDKLASKSKLFNFTSYRKSDVTVGYAYVDIKPTAIANLTTATTIYPSASSSAVYFGLANTTAKAMAFTSNYPWKVYNAAGVEISVDKTNNTFEKILYGHVSDSVKRLNSASSTTTAQTTVSSTATDTGFTLASGDYQYWKWNLRDATGKKVALGFYTIRFENGQEVHVLVNQ